jgi:hypothetical protein
MIKRLTIGALIIVFFLIVVVRLAINFFIIEEDYRRPGRFGSYPNSGLYTFSPETIFESLEQGEIDVFTPYFGGPDEIELYYDPITWSQSDYLKIASALSQKIWGESLGSKNWNVESVYFEQNCTDDPKGFNSFHIVYYKDLGVTNWKRNYTTRLIGIQSWRGLAYRGGDAIFSSTLLSRWENIDLEDFMISADDALQSAEEHGGNKTDKSDCSIISVSMYQHDNEMWDVNYFAAGFRIRIDANSGKYELLNLGQ